MEELLTQFEKAWQQGHSPPRIEDFLPPRSAPGADSSRRQILEELVRLDLEYRWRARSHSTANGPANPSRSPLTADGPPLIECPRLEDYLPCFPELGPFDRLPLELIGAEYFVRHGWGDRPRHGEYLSRFPAHGPVLSQALRQIDGKIAAEMQTREGGRPAPARIELSTANHLPLAMPVGTTAAELLEMLRQGGFLSEAQQKQLMLAEAGGVFESPETLVRELGEKCGFTPYQVGELLAGRGQNLLLGPYLLLDSLGEGATGKVFKARHQRMNRLVALKVIRQELLSDAEVVGRFYREINLAGQLVHPNIVHAYDAGPIGSAHVLVMEYLEGTDLGRLVKKQGPLPVARAREYARQASLGLQHIHERGLVHRDIKPSNLLLSLVPGPLSLAAGPGSEAPGQGQGTRDKGQVIKILDLGLGRLQGTTNGGVTSVITPTGAVMMGTPDYLAPEQASNFHEADIRADIYSLGCTLYYLLSGQPPFPGGSMAEKVAKHLLAEPAAVETLRPDVPVELSAVLRKMLAKDPAERYQTPAEVAAALGGLNSAEPAPLAAALPEALSLSSPSKHRRWVLSGAAALLLAVGVLGLAIALHAFPGRPSATSSPLAANLTTKQQSGPGQSDTSKQSAALKDLILPSQGEDRWLQIPWLSNLWQARRKASAEGKPILLWEMSSHPLGGACSCGISGRVYIFSDQEIIRMAKNDFVPVAADDWYLRRRQDAEGLFFKDIREQGPRKGESDGWQGVYCFTPSGKLLGYKYASRNVDGTREMMKSALQAWKKLPPDSRKPSPAISETPSVDASLVRIPVPGTTVVNVFSRPLEKDRTGKYRRASADLPGGALTARDHFWLAPDEGRELAGLPVSSTRPGPLLSRAIERLCRFHLLDNTRGEPTSWRPEDIRSLRFTTFKVERTADFVLLRLDASVLLATQQDPARADRGYDARVFGTIRWNRQRNTIDQVDLVAIGDSWGESTFSPGARPGRNPLGIVLELSKGEPTDTVPPYGARMIADYLGPQK